MTKPKFSREELVARLQTKGWDLVTGTATHPVKDRSLEDIAREAHARRKKGEDPGLIKKIEDEIELDMLQLEQLWEYLGLPH